MALAVLCWPLRRSEQRTLVWGKLQNPAKWIAELIEPIHIILLGLAIAFGGVIWQWRAAPSTQIAKADSTVQTTPGIGAPPDATIKSIQWNQIFGTTRAIDRVFALMLDGHGPASKSVKLKRAYLESAKTGEVLEMKVAGETTLDEPFPISEANPIPPNGFIRLITKMNPSDNSTKTQYGLLNREFIDRWEKIWFNVDYEVGEPDRISFDLSGYFPELSRPHVTRRSPESAQSDNARPSTAVSAFTYNERDIRELLDLLDEASDLAEKHILPTAAATNNMTANWFGAIPNAGTKQFVENLRKMKAAQKTEIWEPINKLVYDQSDRHQEEMRLAFVLDNEATKGELARALQVAIDAVEKLPDNPSETTRELIKPQFVEADRQAVIVWNWASKVKRRIDGMKAALKTKGVIELEN